MGLLMLKVASDRWVEKCINSLVFVISSTFVLSLIRIFFFHHYKSPDLVWSDFYPALIMGMRVDAKWLLIFIAAGIIIAELLAALFLAIYDRCWCCWSSDYGWSFAW